MSNGLALKLRLFTGLVLFVYAASHLLGHATGLLRLDALDRIGRLVILMPWRTGLGRGVLALSFVIHASLGFVSFARRRTLVMPATEAIQFGLGLLTPLLLLPHVLNVRLGSALYGFDDSYYRLIYQYWITSPLVGLGGQFALMVVLWLHGCVGLHRAFRFQVWYGRWCGVLLALAIILPMLAMLGILNAGWDAQLRSIMSPDFARLHGPAAAGTEGVMAQRALDRLVERVNIGYVALLAAVLAYRAIVIILYRRRGAVMVIFAGRNVRLPHGASLMDAGRLGRVAQPAMCGGRARCSTCLVRILAGGESLPPAGPDEQAMLQRIGAASDLRLACQTYPVADVTVRPLAPLEQRTHRYGIAFAEAQERVVTAMAVDLRDSTQLAEANLPFDTLYFVNRYLSAVLEIVQRHEGYVTSVAGDGVMCVFGLNGASSEGARSGLLAAREIWTTLRTLDGELAQDLRAPIRFGVGLHAGLAVIGAVARSGRSSLQFLGDTGNVASRLEALTKEKNCVVIASRAVVETADLPGDARLRVDYVTLRGRESALPIALFRERGELSALLSAMHPA